MIQISGIAYQYGKKRVLEEISFQVKQGECVGIVGANGCGKSTLLSVLSGVKKPRRGSISYNGQNPMQEKKLFRQMVGYVPQENPLIPELSVLDNLKLWYENKKVLKQFLDGELCKLLGLEVMLHIQVSKLSGGMKKRISIGCAMALNPPIMLLDEPSAALDLTCKEDMKEYLEASLMAGKTILLTTHEEKELDLCDRLLVIKNGRIEEVEHTLRGRDLTVRFE